MRLCLYFCLAVCGSYFLKTTFHAETELLKQETLKQSRSFEKLVSGNPDKIYICPPTVHNNIDPYTNYSNVSTANLISWGGSGHYSKSFQTTLHYNGLSALTGEVFKQDNVYFICGDDLLHLEQYPEGSFSKMMFDYLKQQFRVKGFVSEEGIESTAYVYRFVFEENEAEFKNYYDIEDGEVVRIRGKKQRKIAKKKSYRYNGEYKGVLR